jgi:outer membrane protein OmpA-like peptidoglycan-associated protein
MMDQMEVEKARERVNDRDRDGVPDAEDGCPNAAGPASNLGCPGMRSEDLKLLDVAMRQVQFEPSRAILLEESKQILDQIAEIMTRYPEFSLKISGHTDHIGDDESNQYLSEERAKACFLHLVGAGVDPTRMYFIGYGENMPLTDDRSRLGRQRNRRVEFVLYIKQ